MQSSMLSKTELIQSIEALPDHISIEDVMERLFLLAKIEKGCQEADDGKTVSHEEAEKRMKKWLK